MESYTKIVVGVTTIVILGLATISYGQMVVDPNCPCAFDASNVTANGLYDVCTKPGTFVSKSVCYQNGPNGTQVAPYQFYSCAKYGSTLVLYPRRCQQPLIVVNSTTGTPALTFFNPFNVATAKCDLTVTDPTTIVKPSNTSAWTVPC